MLSLPTRWRGGSDKFSTLATIDSRSSDAQVDVAAPDLDADALRVLVLAPDCNPDWPSTPLVGYSHSEALARLHSVTLVIRRVNEAAIRRRHPPFHAIQSVSLPWVDGVYQWMFRWVFKGNYRSQAMTAASYFLALAFEWHVWRLMKSRILSGEFDVVLRLMPITYVLPSPLPCFSETDPFRSSLVRLMGACHIRLASHRRRSRGSGFHASGTCIDFYLLPGPRTAMQGRSSLLRHRCAPSSRNTGTKCFLCLRTASTSAWIRFHHARVGTPRDDWSWYLWAASFLTRRATWVCGRRNRYGSGKVPLHYRRRWS